MSPLLLEKQILFAFFHANYLKCSRFIAYLKRLEVYNDQATNTFMAAQVRWHTKIFLSMKQGACIFHYV